MPLAQWISAPWNRLGGLVAAVGIAIEVAAFVRFRQIGTTVNPSTRARPRALWRTGVFPLQPQSDVFWSRATADRVGALLGSASPWLVPPLFVLSSPWCRSFPRNRRSVATSRNSTSRTDEAWRGGLACVGDAVLKGRRRRPDSFRPLHPCPDAPFMPCLLVGKNDTEGTTGSSRALSWSGNRETPCRVHAPARTACPNRPAIDALSPVD